MNGLTLEQTEQLTTLIQKNELIEFFEQTDDIGINTPEINTFRKEFIFGVFRYDFYERLQIYINSLSKTDFPVTKNPIRSLEKFKQARLQTLEKNIERAFILLNSCEEQEILALTPREKERMQLEIKEINKNLTKYEVEYKKLIHA
jgi:hypothetical protein